MINSSSSYPSPNSSLPINIPAHQSFNGGGGDDVVPSFFHAQGLSLSLSSHHCSNHSSQSNSQRYETSRSSVPLGPFTGYASILNRSRFLKPAQQVLEDFCGVDHGMKMMLNSPLEESLSENEEAGRIVKDPMITCSDRVEHRWENSRLVLLREEVYKRYKLYCQQIHSVVTSFEAVTGLENAAPCISFAFKSMTKHFTCLKNTILDQIQFMGRTNIGYAEGLRKEETSLLRTSRQGYQDKKLAQNSVFPYPSVLRSQRGLPDHAVAVLKKWLFEHFLNPYPSDSDKLILAHQTGLSRNQVSNWFINARVRVWKPMVEEIHMLETQQDQRVLESSAAGNPNGNQSIDHLQSFSGGTFQTRTLAQKSQYIEPNCIRHKLLPDTCHTSRLKEELINLSHNKTSTIELGGGSRSRVEESSGVSLALGLYQNNRIEQSVPLSMNISQHYGLETETIHGKHF